MTLGTVLRKSGIELERYADYLHERLQGFTGDPQTIADFLRVDPVRQREIRLLAASCQRWAETIGLEGPAE